MDNPVTLPIFPLKTVLFPRGVLPLKIFEPRYMEMTKRCIRDNTPFGVCLIRQGKEVGQPALPFEIGCTASITEWDMPQTGIFQLRTVGENVFRIRTQQVDKLGLIHAEVEFLQPPPRTVVPDEHTELADLLSQILEQTDKAWYSAPDFDNAIWVGDRLLEVLPLPVTQKLRLLEQRDPQATLDAIHDFIANNQPES